MIVLLLCTLPVFSFAADSSFEKSISAFPESYKVYLRQLHEAHPSWQFQALDTGLEWSAAVDAEFAYNRSLVTASTAYTDIFRSRAQGDYDASTNTYIQKDAGFVRANKLAVSYFLDPRNFLYEEGIFQFEKLSFDSTITVKDVEAVLKGSFMYDTTISYYGGTLSDKPDENGNYTYTLKKKKITTDDKYSEIIYKAGKTYNINPCFLASKIINEVGKDGSNSVSGQQEKYPGVYNFYNIGAYDGGNPIEKGLAWASNYGTYKSGTYGRPWITPEKSIMGGAKFNAATYIDAGQNTSYLQKFNVNPNADNPVYTHQYMTNLSGAASPAYETYKSYKANGLLDNKFVFVIPVFKNMPAQNLTSGELALADGRNQLAKTTTLCNVRKGPSTANASIGIQLSSGTKVKVIKTVFTDSKNIDSVMRYPYWSEIEFSSGGKTYTGYVYSNFLEPISYTLVSVGSYVPLSFKTNSALEYKYISSNEQIAQIVSDKTVKFLKSGTVVITAYDSVGRYETVKYKVVSDASAYAVENVTVTEVTNNEATVNFNPLSRYDDYEIYICNANGKLAASAVTDSGSAVISGLSASTQYYAYVIGVGHKSSSDERSMPCGFIGFKTAAPPETPTAVQGLKAVKKDNKTVALSWNKSERALGYYIYTYNPSTKKYTRIGEAKNGATTYNDASENAINNTYYSVRAYNVVDGTQYCTEYCSNVLYTAPEIKPAKVSGLSVSATTSKTASLQWKAVSGATSYQIYRYDTSKKQYVYTASTTKTSYTVSSLSSNKQHKFKVRACIKVYSKTFTGNYSSVVTARTCPAAVSGVKQSDTTLSSFTLKWNAVSGATGYKVYVYNSEKKKYVSLKSTTKTYLKISNLKAGQKPRYKIRAYTKADDKTYYGDYSAEYFATSLPKKPTKITFSSVGKNSLTLSWNKASGATGYAVYQLNPKTGKYAKVASTTKTSVTLKNLSKNTKYTYKIKAISKTKSVKVYGDYSASVSVKTKK